MHNLLNLVTLENIIKQKTAAFANMIRINISEVSTVFTDWLIHVKDLHKYNTRYAGQDNMESILFNIL